MKARPKAPTLPPDRPETVRHEIMSLLRDEEVTCREISQRVGIAEADVWGHLEHIRTALRGELAVAPAQCLSCGFVFKKRERLKGPGKCPVCKGERITEPRFSLS